MIRESLLQNRSACFLVSLILCMSLSGGVRASSMSTAQGEHGPKGGFSIIGSDTCVEGFPCIVGFRIEAINQIKKVYLRDFASNFMQSSGLECSIRELSSESEIRLNTWPDRSGRSGRDAGFDAPDFRDLQPDESLVMWMDVAQLVLPPPSGNVEESNSYPVAGVFPRAGTVDLVCKRIGETGPAAIKRIVVRKATADEQAAIQSLSAEGIGRSWFPDTTFVENEVPETSGLPMESERVVALIGLLRKAVSNANDGLVFLSSYNLDYWGPIDELAAMVQYECLLETERYGEAQDLRNSSPDSWAEVFLSVERGDGLVLRLRLVKSGDMDFIGEMEKRQLERAHSRSE